MPLTSPMNFGAMRLAVTRWFIAATCMKSGSDRNMMGKLQPFIHVPYFFSDAFDLSYEFWGDATGCDQVVYRGNLYEKRFRSEHDGKAPAVYPRSLFLLGCL